MLVLLAVPVILLVAMCHRMLQLHAPSNRLVRNARISGPTWRLVAAHALLALGCLLAMRLVTLAISSGATEILYLVVMLLAWDSIKFAALACLTFVRLSALSVSAVRSQVHAQNMSRRGGSFGAATTGSPG